MQSQPITFEIVLNMVKQLSLADQLRLLEWIVTRLKGMFYSDDSLPEYQQIKERQLSIHNQGWLKLAGTISQDDLQIMTTTIEAECERVDLNEW